MHPHVVSLHRFPVKGFPAEDVTRAVLEPGAGVPGDRVLAVSDGTADTVPGAWNRWSHFFALKKRADLAAMVGPLHRRRGTWHSLLPPGGAPIVIDPADPASRSRAAAAIAATPASGRPRTPSTSSPPMHRRRRRACSTASTGT